MPLEVLLVLVVFGIAGIALLLHLSGRSQPFQLSPETARDQWERHFPDDNIIDVTVAQDGRAALVRTETGPGLLWSLGADTVARHLLDYDLIDRPDGMEIQFHEFGAPRAIVRLSPFELRHWHDLMELV